jgi:hypothetical protein
MQKIEYLTLFSLLLLLLADFIRFDLAFVDRQRLKLTFENVDTATLSGLHVDEALEVRKQRRHLVSSLKMWTPPRLAAFMWTRHEG